MAFSATARRGSDVDDVTSGVRAARLDRPSTAEALATELRRQILDGSVPAGSRLREVEIAETFGVSRQSLRAALAELVHEGLLRRAPHRGVWVPRLTADDLRDVYYMRALIDSEAAARIAGRADRVALIQPALDRFVTVARQTPTIGFQEAHMAFHQAIVDAAGSPRLSRTYRQLWTEAALGLIASRDHPSSAPLNQVETHKALLATILAGPPEVAASAARDHLAIGLEAAIAAVVRED